MYGAEMGNPNPTRSFTDLAWLAGRRETNLKSGDGSMKAMQSDADCRTSTTSSRIYALRPIRAESPESHRTFTSCPARGPNARWR